MTKKKRPRDKQQFSKTIYRKQSQTLNKLQGNQDMKWKLLNIESTGRYKIHMQALLDLCYT